MNMHTPTRGVMASVDISQAVEMWNSGVRQDDMAIKLNVPPVALKSFMKRRRDLFPAKTNESRAVAKQNIDMDIAKEMWTRGATHQEMANVFGISRDSMVGLARRDPENFPLRSRSLVNKRVAERREPVERPAAPSKVVIVAYDAERLQVAKPLHLLGSCECKWPVTDGGPFMFCAAEAVKAYCDHHEQRARRRA